jgi:16S rRNA (adenine1518-N6/adenine1519-N6)-dimethyltransferase
MYTLKKSLGQHFLRDENISRKIVAHLRELPLQPVVEIGPGAGALTKYLLQIPNIEFRAIELDLEKVNYLLNKYPALEGRIMHGDFLQAQKPFDVPFIVIGNFPYNISSQIVFRIIEWKQDVEAMIGMFQKK